MKTIPRILALSIAALAAGSTAYAQDVQPKASDIKTVYEGLDAQGRIIKVTVTSPEGAPSVAITAPSTPALHWTAHIGSGNAASLPH